MSKFELVSNYKPAGDQPAAIAALTKNIQDGVKEQTLLGVTGSGKSVVGTTKVFVSSKNKSFHVPIDSFGSLFTQTLNNKDTTQVAMISDEALQTVAWNPETGSVSYENVQEISRHNYTGALYSVKTSCGRSNIFTDSHNVYVLRDGVLMLLPSSSLMIGDYLPVAERISAVKEDGLQTLDLRQWLPEDAFYVNVSNPQLLSTETMKKFVSTRKSWALIQGRERLDYSSYKLISRTESQLVLDRVSARHRAASIPVSIVVSPQLLRFLGLFIAEGHASNNYITLSTADATIIQEFTEGVKCFGLTLTKRLKIYDYQVSSKVLATLLKTWCGHKAHYKTLPQFWPQLSQLQLGTLLSGIFAGDGGVENHNTIGLSSVSDALIHDVQTALLRFGIHARVRNKFTKYNGKYSKSYSLAITGTDLKIYRQKIGFGLTRKDDALAKICLDLKPHNTNVDVFPLDIELLNNLSKKYKVSQQQIANNIGCTRPLVSMYFSRKRVPSRLKARKLLQFFYALAHINGTDEELTALKKYISNSKLYWSPVKDISTKDVVDEVVYDLSVPISQTFLAGSGSYFVHNTYSMANVIQNIQKPTLVLSHNKTLAAQLYEEFKRFFPNNAVHYFVSYFDYYQPEAYIARSDTYIEKDSQINEEIDRLRHAATDSLLSRKDVIIVASVSCIYGIGSKDDYGGMAVKLKTGERRVRDKLLRQLTDIQYQRNDIDFHRGTFRVRGDVVDIYPAGEEAAYRIEFFGDDIERITEINPLTGEIIKAKSELVVFPSSHYVTPYDKLKVALSSIKEELDDRLKFFKKNNMLLEAQRLQQRTNFDIEMLEETGFVKGIENYSRYLTNREPGEQPATLLDYYPDDFLMFVDESHMTLPQVRGMYNGDRARKEVLVEHGFRMPSALDNRPLTFTEFERHVNQVVYVSATPAEYELSHSPEPVQQVIRPTGLLDPPIEVRPVTGQVDDLIAEIRATVAKHQRVLVTTLTKRMSEDLTEYLKELDIKVTYLHSDVDTLDRTDILRDLRLGVYDVVVGINLLREGLDLPEVSLVAILDADKEGFLRSKQALVQTVGRAARHLEGRVIMYADRITGSMQYTLDETNRRRGIQQAYNDEHGVTPEGISRMIEDSMKADLGEEAKTAKLNLKKIPKDEYKNLVKDLSSQMDLAAANLEFEKAAELRDIIDDIKNKM